MNREEERLVWASALDLFSARLLEGFVLESIREIQRGKPAADTPRIVSPEGMAEVAGLILDDIQRKVSPPLYGARSLNRDHLRALMEIRFLIANHVLMRVPQDLLSPRLSELRFESDLGL